jgi:hypothetical protein
MSATIAKGDTVRILPQWQDPGDEALHWIATEDEDGGRVRIAPLDSGLSIAPNYIVLTTMLEVTP